MDPVDEALELGLLVMRNGGSTVVAERTYAAVLKGYGLEGADVAWRLDFVVAGRVAGGRTEAVLRPVGPIGGNLSRVSAAVVLGERAARGEIAPGALAAEIERVKAIPSPFGRYVAVAAAVLAAACYGQLAGGDYGATAIALVAAGIGQILRGLLQARKVPVAPLTLLCGAFSAFLAGAGLRLGLSQTPPATLIASVIYLVPGLPLINGFLDMVSHRHLFTGLARIANATFLFLLLAVAIAFSVAVFR